MWKGWYLNMDDMSDVRKRLISMALLADIAQENFGVLLNTETKITIGDNTEMKYEGKPQRMRVGDLVQLGADKDNMRNFEVLKTETRANEIELREVQFFKARVATGHGLDEICVVAAHREEAMKTIRKYSTDRGYATLISLNPSKFFKPMVISTDILNGEE